MVESQLRFFRNPNTEKILQLLGSFDERVRSSVENVITEQQKASVDSIRANRNSIAHGRQSSISIAQATGYYEQAKALLARIRDEML